MKFFNKIFNIFIKASEIRNDETKRTKSIRFAISSIICSVLVFVFALLCWLLIKNLAGDLGDVARIVIVVILSVLAVSALLSALLRVIMQLTINRKVISWIALVIFIASTVASALLIIGSLT